MTTFNEITKDLKDTLWFKDRARKIIGYCDQGFQLCEICPLLECNDNNSKEARKLHELERFADEITNYHWNSIHYEEHEYTLSCGCLIEDEDKIDCQECKHTYDPFWETGGCIGALSGCAHCLCGTIDPKYDDEE